MSDYKCQWFSQTLNIGVFALTTATIVDMIMKHACVCSGHVWLRIVLNSVCYMWRFYSQTISGETELKKAHTTNYAWASVYVCGLCAVYNIRLPIYLNIYCDRATTWKFSSFSLPRENVRRRGLVFFFLSFVRSHSCLMCLYWDMINKRLIWM